MSKAVMQLALDALDSKYIVGCGAWQYQKDQAADALRAELAKPEPDPFAYVTKTGLELARQHEDDVPLYCKEDL